MILQVVQLTCGFGEFPASEAARDGSSSQVWLHHAMPRATRCVESELHTRAHTRTCLSPKCPVEATQAAEQGRTRLSPSAPE